MINIDFKSVRELIKAFPNEQVCIDHLEQLRWNGNAVSPFDSTSRVYKCAGNKYKCKNTGKYFNVRTQTLFDNTKIELQTWFLAIYLITCHKKGISSVQLAIDLNVTQKTAWFMNHRIRNCFGITNSESGDGGKMGGDGVVVEVDETIIGGKSKNMNNKKRKELKENPSARNNNKTTVLGYLERGSNVKLEVVKQGGNVPDMVLATVDTTSALMTDQANTYAKIGEQFAYHGVVDHSQKEYSRGIDTTNGIEGCFSLLDRMIIGTYHFVSQKHLQKYLNEHSFRYNSRSETTLSRFNLLLSNSNNRLTYETLISK